jgi:hypothetical protein
MFMVSALTTTRSEGESITEAGSALKRGTGTVGSFPYFRRRERDPR